jgi:hypothetical protein
MPKADQTCPLLSKTVQQTAINVTRVTSATCVTNGTCAIGATATGGTHIAIGAASTDTIVTTGEAVATALLDGAIIVASASAANLIAEDLRSRVAYSRERMVPCFRIY